MNVESIVCSQCGAPLQVPDGLNYVTCNHCHVALTIRRGADVTYTERLDTLESRSETMAEQLADLRDREALNELEQAWEREKNSLLERRRDGTPVVPSVREAWWSCISFSLFILMVTFGCFVMAPNAIHMPILGVAVVIYNLFLLRKEIRRSKKYHEAEARFFRRREELCKEPTLDP